MLRMFLDPLVREQGWQLLGRDGWYPLEEILEIHEGINAMTITSLGQRGRNKGDSGMYWVV